MSSISLEELIRIKDEIKSSPPDDRGDISNVEFAWLYTPRKPLHHLKIQTNETADLFQMGGNGVVFEDYSGTNAVAIVHNHPSGYMMPSMEDLNVLLRGVAQNKNLSHELIASSELGRVTGFYELQHTGKRSKAFALMRSNLNIYCKHLTRKYNFLKKNPELHAKMKIGDRILSLEEYNSMVSEAMNSSSIIGRAHPLNGYKFENWRFVYNFKER